MLCWFLPHINMNQPQIYICSLPLVFMKYRLCVCIICQNTLFIQIYLYEARICQTDWPICFTRRNELMINWATCNQEGFLFFFFFSMGAPPLICEREKNSSIIFFSFPKTLRILCNNTHHLLVPYYKPLLDEKPH